LALVVLVVVGRRGARALASLTAFLAWLLSLPSVLTVAAVLTAKYGWFGITEESLVDGEARFLVDWILVVLTTFPLLLIFSPLPALVLYFVVRRAGEL
jgi:hypothetical protein